MNIRFTKIKDIYNNLKEKKINLQVLYIYLKELYWNEMYENEYLK